MLGGLGMRGETLRGLLLLEEVLLLRDLGGLGLRGGGVLALEELGLLCLLRWGHHGTAGWRAGCRGSGDAVDLLCRGNRILREHRAAALGGGDGLRSCGSEFLILQLLPTPGFHGRAAHFGFLLDFPLLVLPLLVLPPFFGLVGFDLFEEFEFLEVLLEGGAGAVTDGGVGDGGAGVGVVAAFVAEEEEALFFGCCGFVGLELGDGAFSGLWRGLREAVEGVFEFGEDLVGVLWGGRGGED